MIDTTFSVSFGLWQFVALAAFTLLCCTATWWICSRQLRRQELHVSLRLVVFCYLYAMVVIFAMCFVMIGVMTAFTAHLSIVMSLVRQNMVAIVAMLFAAWNALASVLAVTWLGRNSNAHRLANRL